MSHIVKIIKDDIERIASSTDATVQDVTYSIENLSRTTPGIDFREAIHGLESLSDAIKEQKRKQKAIDRIAWEGERRQRYEKGMHYK